MNILLYSALDLSLRQNLVYSAGYYLQEHKANGHPEKIANVLRMTLPYVKKVIKELHKVGLVRFDDDRLTFEEPPRGHFTFTDKGYPFYVSLPIHLLGSATDTAVYAQIAHLAKRKPYQSSSGIATMLNCPRRTVDRAIQRLTEAGHMSIAANKTGYKVLSLNVDCEPPPAPPRAKPVPKPAPIASPLPVKPIERVQVKIDEMPQGELSENAKTLTSWRQRGTWVKVITPLYEDGAPESVLNEIGDLIYEIVADPENADYPFDERWGMDLIANMRRQHKITGTSPSCAYLVKSKLKQIKNEPVIGMHIGKRNVVLVNEEDIVEDAVRRIDNRKRI